MEEQLLGGFNQISSPCHAQSHQIINRCFVTPYERKRNERGMANLQNAFMWLDREWNLVRLVCDCTTFLCIL